MPAPGPRFHIQAWGDPRLPELNYYTDDYPIDVMRLYPIVHVQHRHVITPDLMRTFNEATCNNPV